MREVFNWLPSRDTVVDWGMELHHWVFLAVTFLAVVTVAMNLWHLFPRREY